jgi:hypothetical protein
LKKLLTQFKADRMSGESFGDYCCRLGNEKLCASMGLPMPKH